MRVSPYPRYRFQDSAGREYHGKRVLHQRAPFMWRVGDMGSVRATRDTGGYAVADAEVRTRALQGAGRQQDAIGEYRTFLQKIAGDNPPLAAEARQLLAALERQRSE